MQGSRGVATLALALCCASSTAAFNIPMLGYGRLSTPGGASAPLASQHPRAPLLRGTRGARCGRGAAWGLRMSDEEGGAASWSSMQRVEYYYGDASEVPSAEEGFSDGEEATKIGRVEEIGPRTNA